MNGSICQAANICGAFNKKICTGEVDCDGPIKCNEHSLGNFKEVLPIFKLEGKCHNCGKEKPLTYVNANQKMCENCYVLLVLPRRHAENLA
jgi:hypothetical protein